jgi:hypothetical protein
LDAEEPFLFGATLEFTMKAIATLALSVSVLACVACGQTPAAQSASLTGASVGAELSGDFGFALSESDVGAAVAKDCAAKTKSATARDACVAEVADEAKTEGFRFSPAGDNKVQFASYSGAEVVLSGVLSLSPAGKDSYVATPVGALSGPQAAHMPKGALTLKILAPGKIALSDPQKGTLVYNKK